MIYGIYMPERYDYTKKMINEFGQNYKSFKAITPDDLTENDYHTLSQTFDPKDRKFGVETIYKKKTKLPVALSFFMCYYDAYINKYNFTMVLEDDIKYGVEMTQITKAIRDF